MKGMATILRRELASLFWTPMGWMLLVVSLFVNGFLVWAQLAATGGNVTIALQGGLGKGFLFWMLLITLPPLLSMRLFAEEARSGTLEYLLTSPVTDAAVVIGKFLAATTFMALLWLSVPAYGAIVHQLGTPPDWAALWCAYFGAVLVSGLFVGISLLASSLVRAPLLAAFLAFMACFLWLALPSILSMILVPLRDLFATWTQDWQAVESMLLSAIRSMDVTRHFAQSFMPGVLDSAEVIFFVTWTGFFLFLTTRALEARRWRA